MKIVKDLILVLSIFELYGYAWAQEDSLECNKNSTVTCDQEAEVSNNGRIPMHLKPSNYEIVLQPFINGNLSIRGFVKITFTVQKPTDKIILNIVDIITKNETCKVESIEDGSEVPIMKQTNEQYFQQYIVHLNKNLTVGAEYSISVSFLGFLNSKLVGFYLSTYKDDSGNTRRLAATQFSPTDARKAFPCMDEPVFKATFDITLIREENMTSWSNMPILNSTQVIGQPGWIEDHFETTPIMSTYLIGFLISDFAQRHSDILKNIQFSVITRPDAIDQADYAAYFGPQTLLFLEDYFQVPFPLKKLDMAAIPDFKFNGMENWGLILYRELAMLYDSSLSTVSAKREIVRVISHEIAHQWFGNLVTPEWWSELWLKEGFANFMGYMAADEVEPSWGMMNYLMSETMHSALELDSFHSSHPINVKVDHVDRISEIFDAISYNKGASIIRMMFHFLGDKNYQNGMTNYLKSLKYKNANQDQLWEFLSDAWIQGNASNSPLSVKEVMDTWTLQEGYPVVIVKKTDNSISFHQERFLMEGNMRPQNKSIEAPSWWIPLSYTFQGQENFNETQPAYWMRPEQTSVTLSDNITEHGWIIANIQMTGFYRVNYEESNWDEIISQLLSNHSAIHPLNRAQLLEDSFNLARAGNLSYSIALRLSKYLKSEESLTPWVNFLNNIIFIYKQASYMDESNFKIVKVYIRDLVTPLFDKLNLVDEIDDDYEKQTLRSKIVWWACQTGYAKCVEGVKDYFNQWLSNSSKKSLDAIKNIKTTVLCIGIREGSEAAWNKTFQRYIESNIHTEKKDLLSNLGCTTNEKILERYISMVFDENSYIKTQDGATVFHSVSKTKGGRTLAWNAVKSKWNFIIQKFGSGSPLIWRMLNAPTQTFGSKELLRQLQDFETATKDSIGSAKQTLNRSIEGAILNLSWKETRFSKILAWLKTNYPQSVSTV